MSNIVISALEQAADDIEVVERKGLGHPDTICDALAETFSRNLCRAYLDRFGEVLHYNVDKALLCGGSAVPVFGGGTVSKPIEITLAGRAIHECAGALVPIDEIAVEGSREWLRGAFHALDPARHVRISSCVAPGSADLRALFGRAQTRAAPLANDTSIGVGYAPLSPLELLVLDVERSINARDRSRLHPAWGEDVKVMAVRRGASVELTIACAMIGRYLSHIDDYVAEKQALAVLPEKLAEARGFPDCRVDVNLADDLSNGQCYLTVTGTSAEAGDDGEVGRGNRPNGLITPGRPMSLEAAAGKNPVTHVGKIYNVVARQIAETMLAELPDLSSAQCLLVSRIGQPISQPACIQVKLRARDGRSPDAFAHRADEIAQASLARIPTMLDDFVAGKVQLF